MQLRKRLLGVISFVPLLYTAFFAVALWWWANVLDVSKMTDATPLRIGFGAVMAMHLLVLGLMIGLTIYYIRLVVADPQLSADRKTVWILGILFLNPLAFPVAYYVHVKSRNGSIGENSQSD
jgi:hypothetical protein